MSTTGVSQTRYLSINYYVPKNLIYVSKPNVILDIKNAIYFLVLDSRFHLICHCNVLFHRIGVLMRCRVQSCRGISPSLRMLLILWAFKAFHCYVRDCFNIQKIQDRKPNKFALWKKRNLNNEISWNNWF